MPTPTLLRHPDLETLTTRLAAQIDGPRPNPFTPDRVIVSNGALRAWLHQRLALQNGVCANVVVQTWDRFVDDLSAALTPTEDPSPADPWSDADLPWAILAELSALTNPAPELARLAHYVAPEHGTRRRVLLAQELTGVIRRTLAWRDLDEATWHAPWLGALFDRLTARLGDAHPGHRLPQLAEQLQATDLSPEFASRLCIFGLDGASPSQLALLPGLARSLDVTVFHHGPSAELHDIVRAAARPDCDESTPEALATLIRDAAHPLVASLGRTAREAEYWLARTLPDVEPTSLEDATDDEPATLLAHLQRDLAENRPRGHGDHATVELADDDRSIVIHDCHGPTRELEVLRDELLRMMETSKPRLEPRDILVLCPDIHALAPRIAHVFGAGAEQSRADSDGAWGEAGFPKLPFDIAGRTELADNQVAQTLRHVLALSTERFAVSSLVDLLALDPVRRRFGLDPEQLDEIPGWLETAAVHWGRDEAHREVEHRPAQPDFTWKQGLDRLLLGLAMQGDDETMWAGLLPVDDVEGGGADVVYALVACVRSIVECIEQLVGDQPDLPRSAAHWRAGVESMLERFVRPSFEMRWQEVRVRQELDGLLSRLEANACELDVDGFIAAFDTHLDSLQGSGRYGAGRITFADLAAHRALPHRVVAVVGLDIDAFPRRPIVPDYDPVAAHPRVGDRIPHERDRHAFWCAITAAREALILTWSGHSERNNAPHPPSVVVTELLDTLSDGYRFAGHDAAAMKDALVVRHPLHPHGEGAFVAEASNRAQPSANQRAYRAARAVRLRGEEDAPATSFFAGELGAPQDLDEVSLYGFNSFFTSPARALLKSRLAVSFDDSVDVLADHDPLSLDALGGWGLRDRILRADLQGIDPAVIQKVSRAAGKLPLGVAGDLDYRARLLEAKAIADAARARLNGATPARRHVQGEIDGLQVAGRVDGLFPGGRVWISASKPKPKWMLRMWVDHVFLTAFDEEFGGQTWMVGEGKGGAAVLRFDALERDEARTRLDELVELWRAGQQLPLPFSPAPSLAWLEAHAAQDELPPEERDAGAADAAASSAWTARNAFDAGQDPHVQRAFGEDAPLGDLSELGIPLPETLQFAPLAQRVLAPLVANVEKETP